MASPLAGEKHEMGGCRYASIIQSRGKLNICFNAGREVFFER